MSTDRGRNTGKCGERERARFVAVLYCRPAPVPTSWVIHQRRFSSSLNRKNKPPKWRADARRQTAGSVRRNKWSGRCGPPRVAPGPAGCGRCRLPAALSPSTHRRPAAVPYAEEQYRRRETPAFSARPGPNRRRRPDIHRLRSFALGSERNVAARRIESYCCGFCVQCPPREVRGMSRMNLKWTTSDTHRRSPETMHKKSPKPSATIQLDTATRKVGSQR